MILMHKQHLLMIPISFVNFFFQLLEYNTTMVDDGDSFINCQWTEKFVSSHKLQLSAILLVVTDLADGVSGNPVT